MTSLAGVHALIIEDEQVSIDVLDNLLAQLDVSASVIYGGPTIAGDIEQEPRPDIVFLDLEMPGLNGYDVLDLLRADPKFDGVPIVAYTTHLSHMNNARDAGFDGFLGKPLRREEFAANLIHILEGGDVWEA